MPIAYRKSLTWPSTANRSSDYVIGSSETIIGRSDESAGKLVELLFGPPYNQVIRYEELTTKVTRKVSLVAVRRG